MICSFRFIVVATAALAVALAAPEDGATTHHSVRRGLQRNKPICPLFPCLDPCIGKCTVGQLCVTKTPEPKIKGCTECPVFDKCIKDFIVCPLIACLDPCTEKVCGVGEICLTKAPPVPSTDGCPDCPIFDKCTLDL